MNQSIIAITERNIALYNALNDIDDRREAIIRTRSFGPHEPCSAFGHYDVEDVDDGGRLIERRERGIGKKFIPVSELPASIAALEPNDEAHDDVPGLPDMIEKPLTSLPHEMQIEEIRYLVCREQRPSVILRRRTTLRTI